MTRLKKKYLEEVKPALIETWGYQNNMQVPKLIKIVISMGLSVALKEKNVLEDSMKELALISGQHPLVTRSRKAIANFKLREGQAIGLKVTLRGVRMFHFFDRFVHIVCPRIRDFRGFKKKGDGRGSYSIGLSDHRVFPELNLDQVKREQGMNITFVTSAFNERECLDLLASLGFPFERE